MISSRKEFVIYYWRYYCVLEEDFLNLTKYIDIRKNNFLTSSDIIIKQLQTVGAEFDIICKEIEGVELNERININNHYQWIVENTINKLNELGISKIQDLAIGIKDLDNIIINPFMDWKVNRPGDLKWWKAYNNVKHSRTLNYEEGNFENLLNALGALYFMERLLLEKIIKNTNDVDILDKDSKIFHIKGWEDKWINANDIYIEKIYEDDGTILIG